MTDWRALEVLDALERQRRLEFDQARARLIRVLTVQDGSISAPPFPEAHDRRMAPVLLELDDVADTLQVSLATVKRLVKAGKLRAVKVEGATRVHRDDLAQYVDSLRAEQEVTV